MEHYTRNWKHCTKDQRQYGYRDTSRYDTPFMLLDEEYLDDEDEN